MQWNGSAWVPASSNTITSSTSVSQYNASSSTSNRVQQYTDYYHAYTRLATANPSVEWYQYQADQSSRAAHYFHQVRQYMS